MENKKKILIVCGGINDLFLFESSIYYTSFCKNFDKFITQHALIFPDGKINFPKSLEKNDIEAAEKYDIFEAGCLIKKMDIYVIFYVPCGYKALTAYRVAFELLDIPIVGPSAESQFMSTNKINTRARLGIEGIKIAPGCVIRHEDKDNLENALMKIREQNFTFPVVVKAPCEDDSLGVYVVYEEKDLMQAINGALSYQKKTEVLIEKFIPGKEIRTSVIQKEDSTLVLLGVFEYELEKEDDIRTYANKHPDFKALKNEETKILRTLILDEQKDADLIKRLEEISFRCFRALNVDDSAVFDFRYNSQEDEFYLLEAGLYCHYSTNSNVVLMAKAKGIPLDTLIEIGINNAVKRSMTKKALKN